MKAVRTMAALGAAIVALVLLAPPASAKSFSVAAVEVQAVLEPDASMRVVEHITYDFSGDFHHGTRPIPRGDYDITDMTVSEGGEPLPAEGAPYNLSWSFSASNERRTFDIAYTVLRVAKVGPDVGELFWKWVGSNQPGVGVVRVELTVPGEGVGVRAWGHGPLNGRVQVQGRRVLFSVDRLPGGQFVEGRVAVPAAAFTGAIPTGAERLPAILAEESRNAEEANARRAAEAKRAQRVAELRRVARDIYPFVLAAGWLAFVVIWLRWGREYPLSHDVGDYVREPFDDPPAVVPTLFHWGQVPSVALSATIVDLAQRGYLTIEELQEHHLLRDRKDWRFTRTDKAPGDLTDFERQVVDQLFGAGPSTTQSDFVAWARSHRTDADRWWRRFKELVGRDFKRRDYIEGGKGPAYLLNMAAIIAIDAVSIAMLAWGQVIGLVGLVSSGVMLALMPLLRRRTRAGAQRTAEWKAFEHFLRDFSRLEEAPVASMVLWERYLVYAVALGVTAEVARALEARIPPAAAGQPAFAPWFIGFHGPGAMGSIGGLSEFAHSFAPTIAAAVAPPASSSSGFGGGGFSGGGGGGGGGGGIGAS